ncbi:uridine phosphorylase [Salmonella enterica subsp. enterica serovar Typhimurium str. DT104]|nr:uridine phosphorylase [Salmonella enterica subsp. enterica serovar Typhimurium str. DT104]
MSKSDVFHLGLTKNDLQGAQLAIVPGDPERVEKIAALMDKPVKLASHREFTSWRAELDGKAVIVCSTGIGGPSTSIAVEELAQLGIRTFLRIGTTGAIQPHINVGDVLVTTASVRLDGGACILRRWNSRRLPTLPAPLRWLKPRNRLAPRLTLA